MINLIPRQILLFFCLFCLSSTAIADQDVDLSTLSLSKLLELKITTASGVEESLIDAPAAMVIIDSETFKKRGYYSLVDILADLPGFDVIKSGSASPVTFYQRGYRSPFSSRTLLMINGVIDNHIWTQEALLSRQYPVSNIERVEVLYGPASVVYGPNAFLGIINVITKTAEDFEPGEHELEMRVELGSWHSQGAEINALGNLHGIKYSLSARFFKSDEEDLSARWGFLSNDLYQDKNIWGPIRDLSNDGDSFDHYSDPTDDYGFNGDISYENWKLGVIHWKTNEGYGSNFAADRGQANGSWNNDANQLYLQHTGLPSDKLKIKTTALYHDNRIWGNWAEAEPDWRDDQELFSFISFTHWNSTSDTKELKQDIEFDINMKWRVITGWRYKHSDVTKAYDIPGYWGAYSSTTPVDELGPYGFGAGIFHSNDANYTFNDLPVNEVPSENRQTFNDKGLYFSAIYNRYPWNINSGLRYDKNNLWGSSVSPRMSVIYKLNENTSAIKLIYGEAFQEPPAQQLYGGWNGRNANPDLLPEEAENIELVLMHQAEHWLHDVSLYKADYKNVIRESALNDAKRDIWGGEYRGRFEYLHFIDGLENISGYFYYTYTKPETNKSYDHNSGQWLNKTVRLGDIAPHKINALVYLPVSEFLAVAIRGNFISSTELYSRNPLNEQGIKLGSRVTYDATLSFEAEQFSASLRVDNVFDTKDMGPGLRSADSGNDFSQRSKGYNNSLIPLPGRSLWFAATYRF